MTDEHVDSWMFDFADAVAARTVAKLFNDSQDPIIRKVVSDAVRLSVLEALHDSPLITGNGDDRP